MRRIKRFFSHWQNWLGALIVLFICSRGVDRAIVIPTQ